MPSTARRVSHSEITPIQTYEEGGSGERDGVVEAVALSSGDGGGDGDVGGSGSGGGGADRGFRQGARAPSAKRNSALERTTPGSSSESDSDEESTNGTRQGQRPPSAPGWDIG